LYTIIMPFKTKYVFICVSRRRAGAGGCIEYPPQAAREGAQEISCPLRYTPSPILVPKNLKNYS